MSLSEQRETGAAAEKYMETLIQGPVSPIVNADANTKPASLASGVATQAHRFLQSPLRDAG
ncbi:MAG: hypothetical protein R3C56_41235 [Pirellulaceae bacterium]